LFDKTTPKVINLKIGGHLKEFEHYFISMSRCCQYTIAARQKDCCQQHIDYSATARRQVRRIQRAADLSNRL